MLIGIVGRTNVGKSTFFKAATLAEVEIANFPFTTIKPNTGIGYVKLKDPAIEFKKRSNPREGYILDDYRFVPVNLIDVAGLIEGAHEGKGLGLEFLNDLNQADVLIHIVDISGSTNEKGNPVPPLTHDPIKDIAFLENELDYWHLSILKKGWDKFVKIISGKDNQNIKTALAKQLSGLKITEEIIEESIKKLKLIHHPLEWSEKDLFDLASELRKKTKSVIIAANKIDILGAELNYHKLKEKFPKMLIIPCSAESELALREAAKHHLIAYIPGEKTFEVLSDKLTQEQERALDFIKKNVLEKYSTGVQEILDRAVFEFLKYIAVFPVASNRLTDKEGRCLPDCYLVPQNTTALDFAYRVHTDLGKGFIRALDVRSKRVIGKDYRLKHRDVIEIVA